MDWRTEYKSRLLSAEEAVKEVKSGDRVSIPVGTEPGSLIRALFDRASELRGVTVNTVAASTDVGWYDEGYEDSFTIDVVNYAGGVARRALDAKRATFTPDIHHMMNKVYSDERRRGQRKEIDVLMIQTTPPNSQGYVNIGPSLWWKRLHAMRARKVLAEVNEKLQWCFGDTFLHVSQVHGFTVYSPLMLSQEEVERRLQDDVPEGRREKVRQLLMERPPDTWERMLALIGTAPQSVFDWAMRVTGLADPTDVEKTIWQYAQTLINDGDCIQIGVGTPSAYCHSCRALDEKVDLGYHSEMTARGIAQYIDAGVISGRRKNFMPGKAIASAWEGASLMDLEIIDSNPRFELYNPTWTEDPRVLSQNDNQVAINNAIYIDFTGQVNAETGVGGRMINGLGGQLDTVLGALLSRGGRSIHLLRSTGLDGAVSSIVPQLEAGMAVTTPRGLVDYVVTEYGIANLMGKNFRERAAELIAVAHPDFRAELTREAQALFYPS